MSLERKCKWSRCYGRTWNEHLACKNEFGDGYKAGNSFRCADRLTSFECCPECEFYLK